MPQRREDVEGLRKALSRAKEPQVLQSELCSSSGCALLPSLPSTTIPRLSPNPPLGLSLQGLWNCSVSVLRYLTYQE